MKTKIFYFSGTGNCYVVAKYLAEDFKADLISIPEVVNANKIQIDAETIGIVFPAYIAPVVGIPPMVERFVRQMPDIGSFRIFAVSTCGGYECVNALPSLKKLRHVIKTCGGKLSEEYSVRLPMNNLEYDHIPVPIERDSEVILNRSWTKIEKVCYRISSKKGTGYKIAKDLFLLLMEPMYRLMRGPVIKDLKEKAKEPADTNLNCLELLPLTDKSITVDDQCTGCGTCARVCPAGNIKIVDKKPEFQHRCVVCFACDEWCPSGAIHHWSRAHGIKYHHPEVKLSDMLQRESCSHCENQSVSGQ